MPAGATVAIVLGAVLLAAGAIVVIIRLQRRSRRTPAEVALRQVSKEHNAELKQSQSTLRSAARAHDTAVRAAEKAMAAAQLVGRSRVASYSGKDGKLVLYEDRLSYNGHDVPLTPDIHASVDTAGDMFTKSRSTFTRIGVGAMLLGPVGLVAGAAARKSKVRDARELYLMVESEAFAAVVTCDPAHGATVRRLAVAIMNKARDVHGAAARHYAAVATAHVALDQVRADTGSVETARKQLESAAANTTALAAAQERVDAERRDGAR